jgi:hypothetical protein
MIAPTAALKIYPALPARPRTYRNEEDRFATKRRESMNSTSKYSIIAMALVALLPVFGLSPALGQGMTGAATQMASSLTGQQQSAATKALCSALAGNYKDAASAGASGLANPKVLATAATSYAGSMHVSVGSATTLLKGFATQHASDILTSCAAGNAARGLTSGMPGTSSMPAMPKMP